MGTSKRMRSATNTKPTAIVNFRYDPKKLDYARRLAGMLNKPLNEMLAKRLDEFVDENLEELPKKIRQEVEAKAL